MKKRYIIFLQDIWNNLYWIGEYKSLSDAIPDINNELSGYGVSIDELQEYPSTFNMCFDTEIMTGEDEDSGESIMIRGFILEED